MPSIAGSEVVVPKQLSPEALERLIDSMHAVHCQVFTSVEREAFARFIVKPRADHTWILLHRNEEGALVGYFALHVVERELDGRPAALFRVQAGILRAYRGSSSNIRFALQRGLAYRLANPGRRLYYLGAILHPTAYSALAKHFRVVHPGPGTDTSPEMVAFIDRLANELGLPLVDPTRPLLRKLAFWTRESEAERAYWRQCDKPAARFFVEQNPGYGEGHVLMTVVPVTLLELLTMMKRAMGQRARRFAAAVTARIPSVLEARRRLAAGGQSRI